jgi:dienelactone hydrolase
MNDISREFSTRIAMQKQKKLSGSAAMRAVARACGMAMTAVGLACALPAGAQAGVTAVAKNFDPVAQDPIIVDKAHPPLVHEVRFDSDGVTLYGKVYSAQGSSPRPTVLIARGYPDMTSSADIALTLQRAGYNAMIFNYRGTWGMGGGYLLENAYQDMRAALAFLRTYQTSKTMLVDPNNIVLFGYSMGAPVALRLAANDAGIRGVMELDGMDLRVMPTLTAQQRTEFAADLKTPAVPDADGAKIVGEVVDHFDNWNPENYTMGLTGKDVFLLWATHGNGGETHTWGKSLHDMYVAQARVTEKTLDTNHDFSDRRIEVARSTLAWLDKVHFAPAGFAQRTEAEERQRVVISLEQLEKVVGVYKDANGLLFYLKVEDGKLMQSDVERQWTAVEPLDNHKFSIVADQPHNCNGFVTNEDEKGDVVSLTAQCQGRSVALMHTSSELVLPAEPQVVDVPVDVLKTYVGKYRLPLKFQPMSYFSVSLKGSQLIVTPEGNAAIPLYPMTDNKFFGRVMVVEAEFVKEDNGAITHIHAKMDDGEYDFPREQ